MAIDPRSTVFEKSANPLTILSRSVNLCSFWRSNPSIRELMHPSPPSHLRPCCTGQLVTSVFRATPYRVFMTCYTQHVAEHSTAQKIVPGDMLHGYRFSMIWCCAENCCCKLSRPLLAKHGEPSFFSKVVVTWLRVGINRLCSATFEQLLTFWKTFYSASNLEQLLPSLATFEQQIGIKLIQTIKKVFI